ncbi:MULTISPECIES: TlpA disulfide reductase family protein [unclassified Bacillus (in: firmicutes)]|uniref:TlpA family protein disulfide reductase n=1 Tax=unclassified Bacillus (in: firmicutes) TaxID=185979 RepID=UPI001BEC6B5D|nr:MULTISPECIES: TlpA disulfide reductase family protein [unclassified Bacillus (in: firmicutes)]MBT2638401.1 TlpA family protein disulfide reductase [Bacillus sp. ISL-39]MBT2662233.1 TlpA family protein disulfide reductase [Bacillus sp. ISL-45]
MGKKIVPVIVIAAVIGVLGFLVSGLGGKASAQPGDQSIEFELQDIEGNTYKLSDFKGQPVVLNFFATWCAPCIDEAPELEAFGKEYKDAKLLILAKGESKKRMEKYISKSGSELTYLLDTKEDISKDYNVIGQPETIIIDGNGVIVERFSGPTTKDDLIKMIQEKVSP